jgi:transposase
VEIDLIRMCELLVGLPEVNVLGLVDEPGGPVRVVVECRPQTQRCSNCGVVAWVKDRSEVTLVDLPVFGRPALLIWRKHRLRCPNPACPVGSWTVEEPQIAAPRLQMTDRAGRWATLQVFSRQGPYRGHPTWPPPHPERTIPLIQAPKGARSSQGRAHDRV